VVRRLLLRWFMLANRLPVWVPVAVPPTPEVPKPIVEPEWLDLEVEGEGEHVLVAPKAFIGRISVYWVWVGNLGDSEVRVGFRWAETPIVWWNKTLAYLDGYGWHPPKPKLGGVGDSLLLRVVGDNARLSVSLLYAEVAGE